MGEGRDAVGRSGGGRREGRASVEPAPMSLRIVVAVVLLAGCRRTVDILNHDPMSPEITGLERVGEGSYTAGKTEKFRLMYSVDGEAAVHWSSSAGPIVAS